MATKELKFSTKITMSHIEYRKIFLLRNYLQNLILKFLQISEIIKNY